MFNNIIRKMVTIAVCCWLLSALSPTVMALDNPFRDVNTDYWGYESIAWAYEQGIIDGYPDGTFKPDSSVGQTEFLAMLIRAYQPKDLMVQEQGGDSDWKVPYVEYASKMGWGGIYIVPPNSKNSDLRRLSGLPEPEYLMRRMYVAKLIAAANGRNYSPDDSIRFLLDSGLAEGKTNNTVEGFQGMDKLTRAEAVTFIKNLKAKMETLYPSPHNEHSYDPNTLALSPFEIYPLEVSIPPDEPSVRFSHVEFENPSAGYTLIHDATYTITGNVLKAVGEDLTVNLEYWESGVFKPNRSIKAPMNSGKIKKTIDIPNAGIYRITIYSNYDGVSQEIALTSFYVEYK